MDPVYGFQAVNVEAQLRTPNSLLRWIQRFVALRKEHPVFGLGTYRTLKASNHKVFAVLREYEGDTVLCVHNIARSAQAVELDLSEFEGRWPEEMLGRTRFPRIGELPYLLTLAPHGFFWFRITEDELPEERFDAALEAAEARTAEEERIAAEDRAAHERAEAEDAAAEAAAEEVGG
jgi:maltose alpha-D-glucosyltransferase/alpha-amylase